MTAHFDDPAAARLWDAYFSEFDRLSAPLGDEAGELRADLENHVRESLASSTMSGDAAREMKDALERLGRPIDFLHPVLGDSYLTDATRTYSPVAVGKGLFHTILAGGSRLLAASLFAVGYAFIAAFVAIALSKLFWPDHVGLFRSPDGSVAAGILRKTAGSEEVLGWWASPVALILAMLIYLLLTKGLARLTRPD